MLLDNTVRDDEYSGGKVMVAPVGVHMMSPVVIERRKQSILKSNSIAGPLEFVALKSSEYVPLSSNRNLIS